MASDVAVTLTESTAVQVTMKQLLIAVGSLLFGLLVLAGGAIGAAAVIVNGIRDDAKASVNLLRDDVKEIRSAVQSFQSSNADLSKQIAVLNASVTALSTKLEEIQKQPSVFDPRFAAALAEQLKKNGLDDQKIVILPVPQLAR
jgi:septal ring factor EnvC (AmiA/AmiB activator)